MTYALPQHTNNKRLLLPLLLAILVHALIIFGLSVNASPLKKNHRQSLPSLDITLVAPSESQTPKKADYLAQLNQDSQQDKPDENYIESQDNANPNNALKHPVSTLNSRHPASSKSKQGQNIDSVVSHEDSLFARNASVISINQLITNTVNFLPSQKAMNNPHTKLRHKTIVRSKKEVEAAYWAKWQNSIEQLGTDNFSRYLKNQRIYGQVIIDISLNPDGSLYGFEVIRSDHPLLTVEVKKLIKLASPFDPIPKELLKLADIFHIKRSWVFENPNAY